MKTAKTLTITWSQEKRKVLDLKPSDYNPRKMTAEEKKDIERSLEGFGRVVPLVVNTGSRENTLIGGHQRWKIYSEKKVEEIDVMVPSRELSLEEEQELNLRLNKNLGSWDYDLLQDMDLELLLDVGFNDDDLQGFFDDVELAEDEFDLEKELKEITEPRVQVGEIWQLGNHRLLVGDSTDTEAVTKLMDANKASVVYCDPPYNIGLDYSEGIGKSKNYGGEYSSKNDSMTDAGYEAFLEQSIATAKSIADENAHFFYWCDAKYIGSLQNIYNKLNIHFKRLCFWVKNNQNPTPQIAFNKVCEPCVYGTIGKPHLNKNFKNANEVLNQEITSGNQLHDELLDMLDLWIVKRDNTQEYQHPTQKPVTLNEKPLRRCSAPGHVVFSGFAGSGSDLIACEQLKRRWFGVEQDLIFATVILNRWEQFTNNQAKRVWPIN
jgi:DNA modification methylase